MTARQGRLKELGAAWGKRSPVHRLHASEALSILNTEQDPQEAIYVAHLDEIAVKRLGKQISVEELRAFFTEAAKEGPIKKLTLPQIGAFEFPGEDNPYFLSYEVAGRHAVFFFTTASLAVKFARTLDDGVDMFHEWLSREYISNVCSGTYWEADKSFLLIRNAASIRDKRFWAVTSEALSHLEGEGNEKVFFAEFDGPAVRKSKLYAPCFSGIAD